MNLKVLNTLLCRTPAFSITDNLDDKWHQLKDLIRESSPSFYQNIEDMSVAPNEVTFRKINFSIWKYFNRARYRSTPYGKFAGFTLLPISNDGPVSPVLAQEMVFHTFTDWKHLDNINEDISALITNPSSIQTNLSFYIVDTEVRYIRMKNDVFEMASVKSFPQLLAILHLCSEKTPKEEVCRRMILEFQMSTLTTYKLLEQMLSLQLLLTEQYPNIIGEDYFKRTKRTTVTGNNDYTIAERALKYGSFSINNLKSVPALIKFLANSLPESTNQSLLNFQSSFLKKYEERMVPLFEAMDPEIGVGYGNFGEYLVENQLTDIFDNSHLSKLPIPAVLDTEFQHFLLVCLIKGQTIRLEEFDGEKEISKLPLPNTLSVMFRLWNGKPVIESIGGCTANALLGRFTIASQELEGFAHQVVQIEEQANPDILFFDIGYQAEKQFDNVNRRSKIYAHELPILTWSCDESPISFNDVLVGVRNSEVLLWSKKYQKRMVPRVPSAYNYSRSNLPVFRFLCDLQHQRLKSDISFDIRGLFPNLTHYPRVFYKDIIVSPAMWLVPAGLIKTDQGNQTNLINWLRQENICFTFKAGHADQTLRFDPDVTQDMYAFWYYCRQHRQQDIFISEALIGSQDGLPDSNGKKYASQYIASYCHREPVYNSYRNLALLQDKHYNHKSIVFPGNEWLYFEIYCHPKRANDLILNYLRPYIKGAGVHIYKWFFIRYDEPKPHIRLRMRLKDPSTNYQCISRLKSVLEPYCSKGFISDIQIKTYFRETARYGIHHIELVEQLFYFDSIYILNALAKTKSTDELILCTLSFIQQLLLIFFDDPSQQTAFVKMMANAFTKELEINSEKFKKLNQRFQNLKSNYSFNFPTPGSIISSSYKKGLLQLANKVTHKERSKLLSELLHMHINRLFDSQQRVFEGTIYHYLLKVLMVRRALSNSPME